jgi:hypothetical protein
LQRARDDGGGGVVVLAAAGVAGLRAGWFVLLNVIVGAAAAAPALLRLLPQSPGFHTEAAPAEDSQATFRGTEEDEWEDVGAA